MEEALRHARVAKTQNPSHLGHFVSDTLLGTPVPTKPHCCIRCRAQLLPGVLSKTLSHPMHPLTSLFRCFSGPYPGKHVASSLAPCLRSWFCTTRWTGRWRYKSLSMFFAEVMRARNKMLRKRPPHECQAICPPKRTLYQA